MPLLNVSRLTDQLRCEVYAHNKWRLKRQPVFENTGARAFGLAWHAAMEVLLKAKAAGTPPSLGSALEAAEPHFELALAQALYEDKIKKIQADRATLEALLPHVEFPPAWKVGAVEEEIQLSLGILPTTGEELTMRGRPDTLVWWEGLLWHVQHKTTGPSVSWPTYERAVQRSFHENLYLEMLARNFGETTIGGTILLGVRRLAPSTVAKDPTSAFHRAYIPNNEADRARALESIMRIADRVHSTDVLAEAGIPLGLIENRAACFGAFANAPCPYVEACLGNVAIEDDVYFKDVDPLASYAVEPASEG